MNALRSHAAEYGWTTPKGLPHVARLIGRVEDPSDPLPQEARAMLKVLVTTIRSLDVQVTELDREIARRVKADPVARRLMTIPGIGPIAATAIVALAPPAESSAGGRHLAAWIGLTPVQKSTGGRQKLGATSKMGERTLRRLLVIGAAAVVNRPSPGVRLHALGWRRCSRASPKCWSSSPWPTRSPEPSGRC